MEVKKPPIVKNKDDYVNKAIEIANDENILDEKNIISKQQMKNFLILKMLVKSLILF